MGTDVVTENKTFDVNRLMYGYLTTVVYKVKRVVHTVEVFGRTKKLYRKELSQLRKEDKLSENQNGK